jgi:hypothetical protein
MVVQERFYTAEEFWELLSQPEYAGKRVELVEGEIRETTPAGGNVLPGFSVKVSAIFPTSK